MGKRLDAEQFEAVGQRLLDMASRFLYTEARPIYQPLSSDMQTFWQQASLPATGLDADVLLNELQAVQRHATFGINHPRSYAYVGGGVNEWGVLATLMASAMNSNALGGDQAVTYIELAIVRWLAELCGFPLEDGAGLLVSGGSQGTLTALAVARQSCARRLGMDLRSESLADLPRLTVYASDQTHSSLQQQTMMLGLGTVRLVASDEHFRINLEALREAVARDRQHGFLPCALVGNAGTTNTGTIDPLDRLADFCAEQHLWFHVDGAYGALGWMDERIRSRYRGVERADSLVVDSHKWLAAPYESGCVLIREQARLLETFAHPTPSYLLSLEHQHPHFSDYGFQLSRAPRALVLWMLLRALGREDIRAMVRGHRDLAGVLAAGINDIPGMRILTTGDLSVVCFRYEPVSLLGDEEQLVQVNQELMHFLQRCNAAYLTLTHLKSRTALRACVLHPWTTLADIQRLLAELRAAVATLDQPARAKGENAHTDMACPAGD